MLIFTTFSSWHNYFKENYFNRFHISYFLKSRLLKVIVTTWSYNTVTVTRGNITGQIESDIQTLRGSDQKHQKQIWSCLAHKRNIAKPSSRNERINRLAREAIEIESKLANIRASSFDFIFQEFLELFPAFYQCFQPTLKAQVKGKEIQPLIRKIHQLYTSFNRFYQV